MESKGIYVHIPFCKRRCFYCHFVKQEYHKETIDLYIRALLKELEMRAHRDNKIDTVYIGGGSPSLLTEKQLSEIMDKVHNVFNVEKEAECTAEMNPEDVTIEKLRFFKQSGINRISLGTQSFIPEDIEYLKRTHTAGQSLDSVRKALENGFENINIDFIVSLPTQTLKTLELNLDTLKRIPVPHVSAYLLEEVEEGEEKDERDNVMYYFVKEKLESLGYEHYEVSNFAKRGYRSHHNLKYWYNEEYIGAGVSACGFEKGVDYKNAVSLDEYLKKIERGVLPVEEEETPDIELRRIVMGLRLGEGIPRTCFVKYHEGLDFMLGNGLLIEKGGRISVHPEKMLLLNEILTYFG